MTSIPRSSYPTIGFIVGFVPGLFFFHDADKAWWQTILIASLLGVALAFVGYFLARGSSDGDG